MVYTGACHISHVTCLLLLEDSHLCRVNTLTWMVPVDILVIRTLLEYFPPFSVRLDKCKILHSESEKLAINSAAHEMVSLCHSFHNNVGNLSLLLTHGI